MDANTELEHVNQALGKCGYHSWTFKKVWQQLDKPNSTPNKPKNKKDTDKKKEVSPIIVSISYVKGVSEALAQAYQRHSVSVAMKPHLTLKRMLVQPKDKKTPHNTAGVVYQIPTLFL